MDRESLTLVTVFLVSVSLLALRCESTANTVALERAQHRIEALEKTCSAPSTIRGALSGEEE